MFASAGYRTRVNCLEGSYAHHYTTDASRLFKFLVDSMIFFKKLQVLLSDPFVSYPHFISQVRDMHPRKCE